MMIIDFWNNISGKKLQDIYRSIIYRLLENSGYDIKIRENSVRRIRNNFYHFSTWLKSVQEKSLFIFHLSAIYMFNVRLPMLKFS